MSWPPISRDDLKEAATTAGFDMVLPLLIRRLIAETSDGLTGIDMPGGSGTAAGGFDGVVTASAGTPFVPEGTSVWELSVGGGQAKANDDYSRRVDAPHGLAAKDVSYVEALLVPWTKARAWQTEKTQEGRWRDVRGYNLDRIHAWLDTAPATTVWLAGKLGKALPGVDSLGEWWQEIWIPSTAVPLDEPIVLAGRDDSASQLLGLIQAGRPLITLGGDLRGDEASAFVAATLVRVGTLDGSPEAARTVLVSDESSLRQLIAQPKPMVMVLSDLALARNLGATHPHTLIARSSGSSDVDVPRLDGDVVASQLKAAGREDDEARKLGALARRSLPALRRALALRPEVLTPSWADATDPILRRLLLIGSWMPGNAGDQEAVSTSIDSPYQAIATRADQLAASPDVPFMNRVGEAWHVIALEDAWTVLSRSFTSEDLERLVDIAFEVLSEIDPVLDLPSEDRWRSGISGAQRKYSTTLRRGISRSLALMGALDNPVLGTTNRTSGGFARSLVRRVLDAANSDTTYRLWASLVDVLTLLAETAPDEFLEAMQDGLEGPDPAHANMFTDNKPSDYGLGSSSLHSSFLWALEGVCWSPDYFDDVVATLVSLAEIDPGGRLSNRPFESLVEILSAWMPQTSVAVDARIRAIRRIVQRNPRIGRRLLLALIPDGHGFQMSHPGPEFRDWKSQAPVTRPELIAVVEVVIQLLIATTTDQPEDQLDLIEKFENVPKQSRAAIVDALKAWAGARADDDGRQVVYEKLRSKVAHHREYRDAAWALPEAELAAMQEVCDALAPSSPSRRHAWLFGADWITLGDFQRRDQFEAYEQELARRRAVAAGEIISESGLDGITDFAQTVKDPHLVGSALAEHSDAYIQFALDHLNHADDSKAALARGYLYRHLRFSTVEERDRLLTMTDDPVVQARILRFSGEPQSAWERLEELDPAVSEHYWREFSYFGLGADFTAATEAGWSLLDADRPAAVIHLLLIYRRSGLSAEEAELMAGALERLAVKGMGEPELRDLQYYDFERVFKLLAQHRDHLGSKRVVMLEWQMFPIVGLEADAPALHRAIAEEPEFFAELMGHAFRAASDRDDEARDDGEPAEADVADGESAPEGDPLSTDAVDDEGADGGDRRIALRAFEVLRSARRCPGVDDAGRLDGERLSTWIDRVRELLQEADRKVIGDLHIGELLAHAPAGADGAPLAEPVRDLLERVRSRDIERGIGIAIFNARGVTSRGMTDGGSQEWALAKAYREHAETVRDWPRTRKIFNDLAETYEADARREDTSAERVRQGLD